MTIKRIALLSVHASPLASPGSKKAGGMNIYVRELAQELAQRGIDVDIYTRRTAPDQPTVDTSLGDAVRVVHIVAGPPQTLEPEAIFAQLSEFTAGVIAFTTKQGLDYDLIYSHYWLSGWVANKLKEVWGTPFVHMFHTLGHMKNRVATSQPSMPDVRVTVETQIIGWADRIIAATPAEHAQLLWLYRADRRKIVIVPPGVNVDRFHPIAKDEAKRRLGLDQSCNLLLFVGRIEPLKAVDTILEAMYLIRRDRRHLLEKMCFAIIGGDPNDPMDCELGRLQELSEELGLEEVVDFLGAKDHSLLPVYYAAATVVIMPSDYESFGLVALEAMASGTPVIASEVGGLAFLVRDQETGFLVPVRDPSALADGINAIMTQPEKRELLSQNAVELAKQFVWSTIAGQLLPVFEDVARHVPSSVSHRKRSEYPPQ